MLKGFGDAWCVGSSHNWLLLLDHNALPFLLNPTSHASIPLPPFPPTFTHIGLLLSHSYFVQVCRKSFVAKFVLNYNNSDANYALATIYGPHYNLGFCNWTTKSWAPLPDPDSKCRSYCDLVFNKSNNCVFALAQDGSIHGWHFSQHEHIPSMVFNVRPTMELLEQTKQFPIHEYDKISMQSYLVMSSEGEGVLLVRRYIGNFVNADGEVVGEGDTLTSYYTQPIVYPYRTKHFNVYKLNLGKVKWEKVTSLGNRVLFLGANESVALSAKAFLGCEPNSIYFTDDRWEEMNMDYSYGGHDLGVFSLQDATIKPLIPYDQKIDPPPIWVVPTPSG